MNFEKQGVKIPFIVILIVFVLTIACELFAAGSELTVMDSASPIRAHNYRINPSTGATPTMVKFGVKSEFGDSTITRISLHNTIKFVSVTTMYLYQGNTLIGSFAPVFNNEWVSISGLNHVIGNNTSQELIIKAELPSNSQNGEMSSSVYEVEYLDSNGATKVVSKWVNGTTHHFYNIAANLELVGIPTISKTSDQSGWTTEMTATFTFNMSADGSTIGQPKSGDFIVKARTNAVDSINCTVSVITIPNNDIADGAWSQVTITATLLSSQVPKSGMYGFELVQANWGFPPNSTIAYQTWGLEDFKTPGTSFFAKITTTVPEVRKNLGVIGEDLYDEISNIIDDKGILAGEDDEILYTSGDSAQPQKKFVFPYHASPSKGHMMSVEYSLSNNMISPRIVGPKYPESEEIIVSMVYPAVDLVTYNDAGGQLAKATFKIQIGTFTGFATANRVGQFAWRTKIHWGNNASYESCGSERDLLNLAPSTSSDGISRPIRFKFGQAGDCHYLGSGSLPIFHLPIRGIPGCYHIEESTNLMDWQEITVWPEYSDTVNSDGTYTTNWLLPLSIMQGRFFRAVAN